MNKPFLIRRLLPEALESIEAVDRAHWRALSSPSEIELLEECASAPDEDLNYLFDDEEPDYQ